MTVWMLYVVVLALTVVGVLRTRPQPDERRRTQKQP
jgi:hypothetical protein